MSAPPARRREAGGRPPLVRLSGVARTFGDGDGVVRALDGVDLTVAPGTMLALHGRSGSGKTTLLNVVGGLDRADAGEVQVCGLDLVAATQRERVLLRRDRLAFVFQAFGLLPVLTAAENVEVPLRLRRLDRDARGARVAELLEMVGLAQRAGHRPAELSGGEQQRVAIARALANEPQLLVADEPTGQLDSATGRRIMDLLRRLVDVTGLAIVVATHDPTLLDTADEALELRDGRLAVGAWAARSTGEFDRAREMSSEVVLPGATAAPGTHATPDPATPTPDDTATTDHVAAPGTGRDAAPVAPPQRRPRFGPDGELLRE